MTHLIYIYLLINAFVMGATFQVWYSRNIKRKKRIDDYIELIVSQLFSFVIGIFLIIYFIYIEPIFKTKKK